ncbi:hypothetical protein WH5701_02694 [Synechococcus sp. WH 5701]|nr:hypothetical protein WH5701_02694 [Synechococcus sp. WH 5701]
MALGPPPFVAELLDPETDLARGIQQP